MAAIGFTFSTDASAYILVHLAWEGAWEDKSTTVKEMLPILVAVSAPTQVHIKAVQCFNEAGPTS